MLKVWGRRSSANVQKVMWLIGELGIEHEHIPAGGPYGIVNTPQFRAMNPNGLVPVIDDGGMTMWESNAIVRYLAAKHGKGKLWPEDPAARAHADQWMDWAATTFQPDVLGLFVAFWRTPEHQRNPQAIRALEQRAGQRVLFLDQILKARPYIAGETFSLGDIPLGVHLYRYFTMGVSYPHVLNVQDWYGRLKDRPAYREHVMVSYDELKGRLSF